MFKMHHYHNKAVSRGDTHITLVNIWHFSALTINFPAAQAGFSMCLSDKAPIITAHKKQANVYSTHK